MKLLCVRMGVSDPIAKRVVARYMSRGRKWPELGLVARVRPLTSGSVMVTFEGNTLQHKDLLERLGAKWNPSIRGFEMPEMKAERAYLTLDQQVRLMKAASMMTPASQLIHENPEFRKAVAAFMKAIHKVIQREGAAAERAWMKVETTSIDVEDDLTRLFKDWAKKGPGDWRDVGGLVSNVIFYGG